MFFSDELKTKVSDIVRKAINEEMSISPIVGHAASVLKNHIEEDCKKRETKKESRLHYKEGMLEEKLFGLCYRVNYKVYTNIDINDFRLFGTTKVATNELILSMCLFNGQPYAPKYDDIIFHELLHIYQYTLNKKDYLIDERYATLYANIGKVLSNPSYTDNDKIFANALYISFPFEQDAMAHGLYGTLSVFKWFQLRYEFEKTEEYAYIFDIEYALENIDEFNEDAFGITKEKCVRILQKAYNRYVSKLSKAYQKAYNDHPVDGLVHFRRFDSLKHHDRLGSNPNDSTTKIT